MNPDSERLKDLMMEPRPSRLPMILGILFLLAASAGGYWFFSHPDQVNMAGVKAKVKAVLDTPVMTAPPPPVEAPTAVAEEPLTPNMQKSAPPQTR